MPILFEKAQPQQEVERHIKCISISKIRFNKIQGVYFIALIVYCRFFHKYIFHNQEMHFKNRALAYYLGCIGKQDNVVVNMCKH